MPKLSPQPNEGNTVGGGAPAELDSAAVGPLPPSPRSSTPAHYTPVRKETIEKRLSRRLDVLDEELTDHELKARIARASLKDLAVVEGIYYDKLSELRGQPNRVVGSDTRAKLGEWMVAAMNELTRRGLTVKLTERVAEVTTGGPTRPEPNNVIDVK